MLPEALSQLADLALPTIPGWWPPAPGWWLVVILVPASCALILRVLRRLKTRQRPLHLALEEIEALNRALATGELSPLPYLDQVNALLKRLLIHGYGEGQVARLSSDEWARALGDFLRRQTKPNAEQRIETSLLGEFRYRPHGRLESQGSDQGDILAACQRLGANLRTALNGLYPPELAP